MVTDKVEKVNTRERGAKFVSLSDLRILGLEIESKILEVKIELERKMNATFLKLGTLIVACSSILFGLLSVFHK